MINKIVANYTIKHLIGSGGMSDVYYAENRLGKKAAIKVLKSELCAIRTIKERFEQEARIMVDIEHKHIRQAYDLDEVSGQPAIIMEYLEGHTLKQLIDKGKISDKKAQKYFDQCVLALRVTHAKEIVHRDIKPSNIFITQDDKVKILDFGIAKVKESGLGTRTNQMLGTPVYMSPEQIKSPKNVDTKSDVYSLAVTFYHALTGKVPYDSTTDSDFEIQSKIVHEDLDLSKVSSFWSTILRPMLAKSSNDRCGINDVSAKNGNQTRDDSTQYDLTLPKPKPQPNPKPIQAPISASYKWLYYLLGGIALAIAVMMGLRGCGGNEQEDMSQINQEIDANGKPIIKMISIPNRNFKLSETEVTIGQYLAFCKATDCHWPQWLEKGSKYNIQTGTDKYYSNLGMSEGNINYPITVVSAIDAEAFCAWMGGRLPSEAEWEYAAKGGENYEYAGSNDLDEIGWYSDNSGKKVARVRQKKANGYGLYDMSGNVREWTSSKNGAYQVSRGGSWGDNDVGCLVSDRGHFPPEGRWINIGFRLAVSQ